jgi:hypothetical protein
VVPLELILAHTDRVAVSIGSLSAYPTGFAFNVGVILRVAERRPRLMGHPAMTHGAYDGEERGPDFLRLGIRFPDGTTATNQHGHPFGDHDPATPILFAHSGGGGGRYFDADFWAWPSPTPGTLTFVCEWPAYDIPETSVDLDTTAILAAADRAVALWPS